eukprot:TRINITY_DN25996_c0_g1_i1.p2 TRINITY_DN25996_c0_g1~~TRINITY_DN25996_c0_g1_i1.p2  ORF type:complete len:284 (-),score=32.93 TRINITY_DN25996_c0_g1_i1:104-859(-)
MQRASQPSCRRRASRTASGRSVQCSAKFKKIEGDKRVVQGKVFVCKDNIDTDQIIPAEYLTLVPSKRDEYEKLGSYAMVGLPEDLYPVRYVKDGEMKTDYPIIVAGANFGCGSSREHAPQSMGAAGCKVVVAESYARIFFRNCIATGEVYPTETVRRIVDEFQTGEEAEVDMEANVLTRLRDGAQFELGPLGDAAPVIDAGGIFEYARNTGMIAQATQPNAAAYSRKTAEVLTRYSTSLRYLGPATILDFP